MLLLLLLWGRLAERSYRLLMPGILPGLLILGGLEE
jgi:hypothetical protein